MFELILLFVLSALFMFISIKGNDDPDPECVTHQWSKDINTEQLICLNCNFRSGNG